MIRAEAEQFVGDSQPPTPDAIGLVADRLTALRVPRSAGAAVALLITLGAAYGDAVTTAATTFTLFYVVALVFGLWFAGIRVGYVVAGLAVAGGAVASLVANPSAPSAWFLIWNAVVDLALYLALAQVLWALRLRLQREVAARQDVLGQLRHAERLTTIGRLASGVAHEIGTPLNVISGRAELIASGALDSAGVKSSAGIVLAQTERVAAIIRQLLDFARRGGTRVERTDLADLVQVTALLLGPMAAKSGVGIVCTGTHPNAHVNRSEMQQVITNLVTNAIHAMPSGGTVELETSVETTHAPGHARAPEQPYAVVRVRDHGTGIAPDVLPKIFDPFFTTRDVGHGTGLGLSVAYGIVQDHHGWISIETKLREGTTVSVHVPQ